MNRLTLSFLVALCMLSWKTPARYGLTNGYSPRMVPGDHLKVTEKQLNDLVFTTDFGYTYNGVLTSHYKYGRLLNPYSSYTPSATIRTTTESTGSSGGSVHVKGYTRKDGTYVSPHTRSAPRRH